MSRNFKPSPGSYYLFFRLIQKFLDPNFFKVMSWKFLVRTIYCLEKLLI